MKHLLLDLLTLPKLLWWRIRYYLAARREMHMRESWLIERSRARELD